MKTFTASQLLVGLIGVFACVNSWAQGINSDTLKWENRASMHQPRSYFPGIEANGKIYAFGGITGRNGSLFVLTDKIEEYDVDEDTWTVKGTLPQPMYGMAVAKLHGAIYIIGGSLDPGGYTVSNKVYRYFPDSGTFDADTIAPLPSPRGFLSASELEGVIFAIGGADGFLGTIKKEVFVYDPVMNEWITGLPLDHVIAGHSSLNFGNTILVFGGTFDWNNANNQVLSYDVLLGNWFPLTHPMNHARVLHGSAAVGNTIYAFGGITTNLSNELSVEAVPDIQADNLWEDISELPYDRRAFGYTSVVAGGDDTYIYIFGGNSGSTVLATTQRFRNIAVAVEEPAAQDQVSVQSPMVLPNPFVTTTTLSYDLKKSADVDLSVYTMEGKLVVQLVRQHQAPGTYRVQFDGHGLEPGVYFSKLNTGPAETGITKMVLIK